MIAKLLYRLRNPRPSKKARETVAACLIELGVGEDFMVDEFADSVAARVAVFSNSERTRLVARVQELQDVITEEVDRRRVALQAIRGMVAYAERYAPDTVAPLKAVVAANKINL